MELRQRSKSYVINKYETGSTKRGTEKIKKERCKMRDYHSPLIILIFLAIFGSTTFYIASYLDNRLPPPPSKNETFENSFQVNNALENLLGLTNIGPKVIGSTENEVLAISYITEEIRKIMTAANPIHTIKYDLQKATGSFFIKRKHQVYNQYVNVQNIIVKIGPHVPTSNGSLLINCHFDSVPTSPGASDDGLNCATMLEILRIISMDSTPLPLHVMFLFNGAEEAVLLGSHAFITQHKWAKEVKAFINLESCGAGGREFMFQTGPEHPWLVKKYGESVPNPSGMVLLEEVFQSGIIPSDTDFRIFRDHGNIPGLDFAHCLNGYVYHTKYDRVEAIKNVIGVLQHTGDNMVALVRSIIYSKEIHNIEDEEIKRGHQVYFDLWGFSFINYSSSTAYTLNVTVSMLSLVTISFIFLKIMKGKELMAIARELLLRICLYIGSLILAILYNLLIGFVLDKIGFSMSWYTHSVWLIPLYFIPTLVFKMATFFSLVYSQKNFLSREIQGQSLHLSVHFFWSLCLLLGTFLSIRSTYIILILTVPCTVVCLVMSLLQLYQKQLIWMGVCSLAAMVSSVYISYLAILTFELFVPITGRMGSDKNPEFLIGLFATFLCSMIFDYVISFTVALKGCYKSFCLLHALHLIAILVVCLTPLGFPYREDEIHPTPQRIIAQHLERTSYNKEGNIIHKDNVFQIEPMDRRGLRMIQNVLPRGYSIERSSNFIVPADPPIIEKPTHLELTFNESLPFIRRLYFNLTDPFNHLKIHIHPLLGNLIAWSLSSDIPKPAEEDGKFYWISYNQGLSNQVWSFWLDLETQEDTEEPIIEIEVKGWTVFNPKFHSPNFSEFLTNFKNWTHINALTGYVKTYVF